MTPILLHPYPAYKDSGIEWLGEIPTHWEVNRLKTFSRIRYGLGQPPRESSEGLPLIRATNVIRGRITEEDMLYVDPDDVPTCRNAFLAEGEIIVVRSGAYTADSAIIPKSYKGSVAGYDMVVTVNGALSEFVAAALLCTYVIDGQLKISSLRSAQPHLNAEELGVAVILLPPLPEQRAIVDFLDRETARIDTLVAKKERLIELLQEKRAALISRAVTRGIDPDAPKRDSGVEWLGEIPAHWDIKRLKRLATKIGSGKTPSGGAEHYVSDGIMLLRSQNVHFRGLQLSDVAFIDAATDDEMAGTRVREGDVLLNITGASLGRCCVARLRHLRANVNQHVCIIRPDGVRSDSSFLARAVESQSIQDQIFNYENGVSRDALNFEQIGTLVLPAPTIKEQRAISAFLDRETAKIDALVTKVREAIDRLKELRSALISAAATGKIDVRNSPR